MPSITTVFADRRLRLLGLSLYYLAILGVLLLLSARRGFSPAPFIYQGF